MSRLAGVMAVVVLLAALSFGAAAAADNGDSTGTVHVDQSTNGPTTTMTATTTVTTTVPSPPPTVRSGRIASPSPETPARSGTPNPLARTGGDLAGPTITGVTLVAVGVILRRRHRRRFAPPGP